MKIEGRVGVGDFCFEIEDGGYGETCGILDQNCVKVGGVGWVGLLYPPPVPRVVKRMLEHDIYLENKDN